MKINLQDIAYGRVRAPDLDLAEKFLLDFGMLRAQRTDTALYMRGYGTGHHLHVTELGSPGVASLAFSVESREDLERATHIPGASAIEDINEPGGGQRVRLTEFNGICIEMVSDVERVNPTAFQMRVMNTIAAPNNRMNDTTVMPRNPAHVHRIGHAVIGTPDIEDTTRWFTEHLGMLISDTVYEGQKDNVLGNFLRIDKGATPVDHHTVLIARAPTAGLHHLSFEVSDIDDVMIGHEFLNNAGYTHLWGVSRHVQGGQIADYWVDPFGVMFEHWTDSDRIDAHHPHRYLTDEESEGPWGQIVTPKFKYHRLTPQVPWTPAGLKGRA